MRPPHLVDALQLVPYLFLQVLAAFLVAPGLLYDLRFALDHQCVPTLVFPFLVQQALVARFQDLTEFGQTALADGLVARGVAFFAGTARTVAHRIVRIMLRLVAIVGPRQFIGQVVQIFRNADRSH